MKVFIFKPSNHFIGKFTVNSLDDVPGGVQRFLTENEPLPPFSYVESSGKTWTIVSQNPLRLEEGRVPNVNADLGRGKMTIEPDHGPSPGIAEPKCSGNAVGIMMIFAGLASLGLSHDIGYPTGFALLNAVEWHILQGGAPDIGYPTGFALLMMLLSFAGAAYSFAGKRSGALVCTWIFFVVTGLVAVTKLIVSTNILVFLIRGDVVGFLLGLWALWNLRGRTKEGPRAGGG